MDIKNLTSGLKSGGKNQREGPAKSAQTDHRQIRPMQSVIIRGLSNLTGEPLNTVACLLVSYGFAPFLKAKGLEEGRVSEALLASARERLVHLGRFPECKAELDAMVGIIKEDLAKGKAKSKAKAGSETPAEVEAKASA